MKVAIVTDSLTNLTAADLDRYPDVYYGYLNVIVNDKAYAEQKEINKANAMIEVANYGVQKWKNLKQWGIQNHIFNSSDISFLNTAIGMERGNFPSDRQCVKILKVLEKAREESYPD